jgi:hypothetical protein
MANESMGKAGTKQETESAESSAVRQSLYPWYDAVWLDSFTRARRIVRKVKPAQLSAFEDAMSVFRTRPDFQVTSFAQLLDDETLAAARTVVRSLHPAELELHEAKKFKRFVVHDHPFFTALQKQLTPLVSEAAGEEVEPKYNFLCLYSAMGVCPVHMDAPEAKWTLDWCIDQSEPWPIHFSEIQAWPDVPDEPEPNPWNRGDWATHITHSGEYTFKPRLMHPGEAILFSGSSQWHYRDAMPANQSRSHCDLVFFHYIPAGTSELVKPENWARLFDIPELEGLEDGRTGSVRVKPTT